MAPAPPSACSTRAAINASMVGATASHAQKEVLAGGYFTAGFPMGDWGEIAGFGLGVDHTDILVPNTSSPLAIRSSLGLHYNFSRTVGVPSSNLPPNSLLELETKNWSLFFGVGPELGARTGNVRPFVFGTVGFDTYWTKSELAGTAGGSPYSANHGDSRLGFAWSAGVGARLEVTSQLAFEVFWGASLSDVDSLGGDSLQDHGVHLGLRWVQ